MTAEEFIAKFPDRKHVNLGNLEDKACPMCGSRGDFHIYATVHTRVTDGRIDSLSGYEWDDSSHCDCGACPYQNTIAHFTVEGLDDALLMTLEIATD